MRRNVFSNVARRELMKQTAVRNKRTTKYMIMYFVSGFQFLNCVLIMYVVSGFQFWNCVFWSLIVLILLSFPMFHNFLTSRYSRYTSFGSQKIRVSLIDFYIISKWTSLFFILILLLCAFVCRKQTTMWNSTAQSN